jgi:SAM-dependent methyltransferase
VSDDRAAPVTEHSSPEELVGFYDRSYSAPDQDAELYSRWRALGAVGKADHVVALCARAGLRVDRTLEVGCGDGALLSELHQRGFGGSLTGLEITESAVAIASRRAEIDEVSLYDGARLPFADRAFDLAILSHVLEHVPRPHALLAEAARASRATLIEVPLEDNLSARRAVKRGHAAEVGHVQRLNRRAVGQMVRAAGLRIVAELDDPLPREVHRFFARSAGARAAADAKWALRAGLYGAAPRAAARLFTLHHACLCVAEEAATDSLPVARGRPASG